MKSNRKSYEKENQILWESSVDGMERKWKYIESGIRCLGKRNSMYDSFSCSVLCYVLFWHRKRRQTTSKECLSPLFSIGENRLFFVLYLLNISINSSYCCDVYDVSNRTFKVSKVDRLIESHLNRTNHFCLWAKCLQKFVTTIGG